MSTSSRHRPPKQRAVIELEPASIWLVGDKTMKPPQPATQVDFDAIWWAFYKDEPFVSMGESQWRAVGAYLQQWARDHEFQMTRLYRRHLHNRPATS